MQENEFSRKLRLMSNEELIEGFNRDVNVMSAVSARFRFHDAMKKEFDRRGFDYSAIGDEHSFSWAHKIELDGKHIKIIE